MTIQIIFSFFLLGRNVFSLIDRSVAPAIFWILIFEAIGACWLYGAWNIGNILKILSPPTPVCKPVVIQMILVFLWYIIPFFLIIHLIHYYISYPYFYYSNDFPDWTYGYGIFLFFVPILQIPLWAIFKLCYNIWNTERKVGII